MLFAWMVLFTTLLFAFLVARQAWQRPRPHTGLWAFSLVLSVAATAAYLLAVRSGPVDDRYFKLYYVLGALWMPAYMGLGSCYLVMRRARAHLLTVAVVVLSAVGAWLVWTAGTRREALAALAGLPGTGVMEIGAWLPVLIVLNSFGVVALVWVAVQSALQARRRQAPFGFALGNALIAGGGLTLGSAGTAARLGAAGTFWLVMAVGWAITFVGFMVVTAQAEVQRRERAANLRS